MILRMMDRAKRHGELVAHLKTKALGLRIADVVGLGG
jgi:hypothetical protein